jgi:hypothetical protein
MNDSLQAPYSNDRAIHAALALESFLDLDCERDVALSLVQEFGIDVNIIQHFREASHVQEKYDAASYVG